MLHVRKRTGHEVTTFDRTTGKLLQSIYVYKAEVVRKTGEKQQCYVSDETLEALRSTAAREQGEGDAFDDMPADFGLVLRDNGRGEHEEVDMDDDASGHSEDCDCAVCIQDYPERDQEA